jgi:hypothetical protein
MGAVLYNEKCDKCGKERPEFFVQVNKTNTSSGGVVVETQFWCLECLRGKSFEGNEWINNQCTMEEETH